MTSRDDGKRIALLVHEVRSPTAALAAIALALSGDDLDDASVRRLIALALAACRGVERVVGDAALGTLRIENVDLAALARDAVAAAALEGAPIRVVAEDVALVRGDAVRLRQAVDNLVANALTHGAGDDNVVVRVRADSGGVVVSVVDGGTGIPLEDQSRIFEPGVQLDPRGHGSGLGLSIVRAIAEAHEGSVTVESVPGSGATFALAVPVTRQPA